LVEVCNVSVFLVKICVDYCHIMVIGRTT